MAPKPSAKELQARAQAASKKIEDKTFGMKNKNTCDCGGVAHTSKLPA